MGPGYFVIAILGCADGGSGCTPVATLQTHYATAAECAAGTRAALEAHNDFDYPSLLAQCRAGTAATTAQAPADRPAVNLRRG